MGPSSFLKEDAPYFFKKIRTDVANVVMQSPIL